MTDDELLRQYVDARSDDSFAGLVTRHGDWVYSVCLRRTGNRADLAQDATQAVFVALARKAKDLVGRRSLAGWLYETARYASLDITKMERRRLKHETEAARMTAERNQGVPDESWSDVAPRIEPAIDRLPGKYRQPILLRFYQGRSHAEIAQALDISEAAAEKRVSRAVDRLARLLGIRHGQGLTAPAVATLLTAHAVSPAPPVVAAAIRTQALSPRVETLTKGVLRMATVKKIKVAGTVAVVLAGSCAIGVVLRPYWIAPTLAQVATAADAPTAEPVVAEITGGVRIELVGVCDAAAPERPWWRPDGAPLDKAPYDGSAGFGQASAERIVKQAADEGQAVREFALRITQPPAATASDAADVECFVVPPAEKPDGYAAGGGGSGAQVSKDVGPVRAVLSRLQANPAGTTLRCRVSSGPWSVRVSAPAATGGGAGDGNFTPATDSKGWTRFSFKTVRPAAGRWRLVVVDTDGKVLKAQVRGSRSFSGPDGSATEMDAWINLPVAKVKELQFQTRASSDQWVEFRNVCVDPAHPTHPQVSGSGDKSRNQP